ncbi:peptidoglycan-binding domain 1 protein [Rivularia sp. IAM M-261]|nr:peptidoglycan-binding domain 1 protein [Calothrix sp. PCC 7716]GJD16503.1 peptidoglycan-binding domain 1 protein [Rivularia sp. IAM M-261]
MSDIGLLMTSILVMGQKVCDNLPQHLAVQHENDLFNTNSTHLPNSTATLQVTPPEFTQLSDTSSAVVFSSNYNVKEILSTILAKVVSEKELLTQGEIVAINPRITTTSLPRVEFGDSGTSVRVIQKLLVSSGYSIEVDGFFGALTETAVKALQYQRKIVVDGIVGQNTWLELTR